MMSSYFVLRPSFQRKLQDLIQIILKERNYSSSSELKIHFLKALKAENSQDMKRPSTFLKTIGSGALGASRCLLAYTPKNRFLFNIGEGTERVAGKHHLKCLLESSAVFITSNCLENTIGLNSLLLSRDVSENKSEKPFTIYGPTGLGQLTDVVSPRLRLKPAYVPVKKSDIEIDESVTVRTVPLYPKDVEPESENNYAVAYICKIAPSKGTLTVRSFVDARIPPGPWQRQLQNGQSVTLPDGRRISPTQLKRDGHRKGTTFIVIDLPSSSYLDSLLWCCDFHPHQGVGPIKVNEDMPEVIVHFSSPEVMKDPRYQQWANAFPPSVCHMVLNENSTCMGLTKPYIMQLQLNHLLPNVFPLLHRSDEIFDDQPYENVSLNSQILTDEYGFTGITVQSDTLLEYRSKWAEKFHSQFNAAINSKKLINSTFYADGEVETSVSHMRHMFKQAKAKLPKEARPYPRVLFLGTGSSPATTTKGHSAILIHTDENSCLLLDCGDGTFGQMIRLMGRQKTEATLRQLKLIFVSHHHFDHQGGVATLIQQRRRAFRTLGQEPEKLFVLFPDENVKEYLEALVKLCEVPTWDEVVFIDNFHLMYKFGKLSTSLFELYNSLGLWNINLCYVAHVKKAFGIAMSHNNGWKLTYSGDTMPSSTLNEIGMNSDLLIHEATFEDDLAKAAEVSRHSTVSQAIEAGRNMNANFTILTHFSQRYFEIPVLEQCPDNVGIAFDNMMVTLDDLPYLPHLHPVLKNVFSLTYSEAKTKNFYKMFPR